MLTLNATMTKKNQRFDIFEPEANCIAEERFGSDTRYHAFGDGPKFVCGVDFIGKKKKKNNNKNTNKQSKPQDDNCLVYSVGSDNNIQFEKAVHTFLQCETHTFDPTLYEPFKGDEYSTFHPWGIGVDGESSRKHGHDFLTKSLYTIMTELGHADRTIDILKFATDMKNENEFRNGLQQQLVPWMDKGEKVTNVSLEKPKSFEEARETQ